MLTRTKSTQKHKKNHEHVDAGRYMGKDSPMDQQQVRTAGEVADDLRVTKSTVHGLIHDGEFPNAFQVGKMWRIPGADLADYIRRNKVKMGITGSSLSSGSASVNNAGGALTVI